MAQRPILDDIRRPQVEQVASLIEERVARVDPSSPSEDYLAVLAGQRQWIATTIVPVAPAGPQIALRIAPCSLPRQSS